MKKTNYKDRNFYIPVLLGLLLTIALTIYRTKTSKPKIRYIEKPPTNIPSNNRPTSPEQHQNRDEGFNRRNNHLVLTKHAKCRMECRHIDESEIQEILNDGSINYSKSDLQNTRGPKYALEGTTHDRQHVRIIFAPEDKGMVVVTVIDLDTDWSCSCD